jgi:hypothetical protein
MSSVLAPLGRGIALKPAYFVVAGETRSVFHRLLLSTAARNPALVTRYAKDSV